MEIKREGLFSYHPLTDKERKNLIILDLVRKKGPLSRTDISKLTDINIVSISNYIKDYIDSGVILEKGFEESSGGRRPELVELNKDTVYVIGIDTGDSQLSGVLTNLESKIIEKKSIRLLSKDTAEITLRMVELVENLVNSAGSQKSGIKSIGIGSSKAEDLLAAREEIEKKTGIPTFIGSDAACAALGEKSSNPQADVSDLLYMHSDIGCGIIMRGDIYLGAGGSAGEMQISDSHISKEEANILLRDSSYLRPWNVYLGIAESARREIEKGIGTKIVSIVKGNIKNVTKEVVIEAAKQGDEIALTIIEAAAINLGVRVSYLINLFNPEMVVMGGGIEKAGDLILKPIQDRVKKFVFARQASIVKIMPSVLSDDAVSVGAAALAIREIFIKS